MLASVIASNTERSRQYLALTKGQTIAALDFLIFNYVIVSGQNNAANFFLVNEQSFNGLDLKNALNGLVRNRILAFNREQNLYSLTKGFKIVLDWMLQNPHAFINHKNLYSILETKFLEINFVPKDLQKIVLHLISSHFCSKKTSSGRVNCFSYQKQKETSYILPTGWRVFS